MWSGDGEVQECALKWSKHIEKIGDKTFMRGYESEVEGLYVEEKSLVK